MNVVKQYIPKIANEFYELRKTGTNVVIAVTMHSVSRCKTRNITIDKVANNVKFHLMQITQLKDKAEFAIHIGKYVAIGCWYKKEKRVTIITCLGNGIKDVVISHVEAIY